MKLRQDGVEFRRELKRQEPKMPIWKLEPIDSNHDCWIGIDCREPVIVRANDEQGARDVAEVKLAPTWGAPPGKHHGASPWQDHYHSSCNRFKNSSYEEDGDDELLEPLGK